MIAINLTTINEGLTSFLERLLIGLSRKLVLKLLFFNPSFLIGKSMIFRIVLSLLAILGAGWFNLVTNAVGTIGSAKMAGLQLESNDTSYVESMIGMNFFSSLSNFQFSGIILAVVLVLVWWKPIKTLIKAWKDSEFHVVAAILIGGMMMTHSTPSEAYYDKSDYAEPYFILPNESAFFVPDVGNNKDNQKAMDTEAYYAENKISAKRFMIPHVKLANSGLFSDFYVPAGRLLIVDHIPYHREWVAAANRGTSTKDQSIHCQSSEGLDIDVGVSITTSISFKDSAKYLWWFGVDMPAGSRTDPSVIFTSVYHARQLSYVMDNIGRGKIVNVMCKEISARTLNNANKDAAAIMTIVEGETTAFLKARGITVDSMGWADTFTFDPRVQTAINDQFIGTTVGPALSVLERIASIEVKHGLAEGLKKGLPNFMPAGFTKFFESIFGGSPASMPEISPTKK